MTVTTTIPCPLFCEGGEGSVASSFTKGTATVTCCDKCRGGSFKVRVTDLVHYLPAPEPVGYQHRNGLVTLTGSLR